MNDRILRNLVFAVTAILAVLLVVAIVFIFVADSEDPKLQEGISYLESLEEKEPFDQTELVSSEDAENTEFSEGTTEPSESEEVTDPSGLSAEQLALIEQIENDEVDVWSLFHDYVILGDSRAVGFWYFDFLPEEHCLTGGGDTIRNVGMNMDGIMERQPKYIFLCYGLNDTSIGYWKTSDVYVEEMMEVIADLQDRLPGVTVVVSSILPARDPAFERSSKWYNIPEYSAAVEAACKEAGVIFVNNDEICEEYAHWWQPDGIHVRPEFYPYWAKNLIIGIIKGGAYE